MNATPHVSTPPSLFSAAGLRHLGQSYVMWGRLALFGATPLETAAGPGGSVRAPWGYRAVAALYVFLCGVVPASVLGYWIWDVVRGLADSKIGWVGALVVMGIEILVCGAIVLPLCFWLFTKTSYPLARLLGIQDKLRFTFE